MKTEQIIAVGKARSLLPNSSPQILKPLMGHGGTFQVIWIEAIDAHGLFYQRDGADSATMIATHHNGYSCHNLAERIISGNHKRACDQLEYIRRCGGTAISSEFIATAPQQGQAE